MTDESLIEGIDLARIMQGRDHSPLVYFIRIGDRVKIGTTTDLTQRVAGLGLAMQDVAKVVPGDRNVEQAFHRRWARYRVYTDREWFFVRGSLTGFLRSCLPRTPKRRRAPLRAIPRPSPTEGGKDLTTLRHAIDDGVVHITYLALLKARDRDPEFPEPVGETKPGCPYHYRTADLVQWWRSRARFAAS